MGGAAQEQDEANFFYELEESAMFPTVKRIYQRLN
jgi:hypothetical protein